MATKRRAAVKHIVKVHTESHLRWLALRDLLAMLDASSFGGGKSYRCLTPKEQERLEEIRALVAKSA